MTILSENDRHFWGVELLGALLAPRWPQMRSGPPVELHLEASWSLCWRQDGPSGAKMSQVGTKLAVKFGKLRTKRRILYIHKLPIHRKAATMLLIHQDTHTPDTLTPDTHAPDVVKHTIPAHTHTPDHTPDTKFTNTAFQLPKRGQVRGI